MSGKREDVIPEDQAFLRCSGILQCEKVQLVEVMHHYYEHWDSVFTEGKRSEEIQFNHHLWLTSVSWRRPASLLLGPFHCLHTVQVWIWLHLSLWMVGHHATSRILEVVFILPQRVFLMGCCGNKSKTWEPAWQKQTAASWTHTVLVVQQFVYSGCT